MSPIFLFRDCDYPKVDVYNFPAHCSFTAHLTSFSNF